MLCHFREAVSVKPGVYLAPRPQLWPLQEAGLEMGFLRGDLSQDCPLAKGSRGGRVGGEMG